MENNVEQLEDLNDNESKKSIETKPTVPLKDKKNGKEERSRKKDDKNIEQILKSLNNLGTPEEKLNSLCKKYLEVLDENRKLQATVKQSEKNIALILREKDQCQSEKSKAVLAKSRLENLCRELQRQNKAVKEESLLKIREEEEKRKEVSAKFQSTLAEITQLMAETNEKNVKLHEDNIEIHKKFKSVFDEMDIREQHFEGMHQMMKHELQVAEAKLNKVTSEMSEEKESLLKDKNTLLLKLAEYQKRIHELQTVEANLRSQVEMYTDKYQEFQTALAKSNEVFGGFNEEMDKMSKKIVKLEKETCMWKLRWEKSQTALLEMATDKQTRDSEVLKLNKKCSLLQELCKTFQQERATLIAQLKERSGNASEIESKNKIENSCNLRCCGEDHLINTKLNVLTLKEKLHSTDTGESKETGSETVSTLNNFSNKDLIAQHGDKIKGADLSDKKISSIEKSTNTINETPVESVECQTKIKNINVPIEQESNIQQLSTEPNSSKENTLVNSDFLNINVINGTENTQILSHTNTLDQYVEEDTKVKEDSDPAISQSSEEIKCDTVNVNSIPKEDMKSQIEFNKKHKDGKKKRK